MLDIRPGHRPALDDPEVRRAGRGDGRYHQISAYKLTLQRGMHHHGHPSWSSNCHLSDGVPGE